MPAFPDLCVDARMALVWGDPLQGTMLVLIVVPAHEQLDPLLRVGQAGEAFVGVVRPILERTEQGLGEGIVVTY